MDARPNPTDCETQQEVPRPPDGFDAALPDPNPALFRANRDGAPMALTVDAAAYEHLLEDSDLSAAQKRELLQTLWEIICEFVAMGFGVHPLQQVETRNRERDIETQFESSASGDGAAVKGE